ncbi:ATP-utilizing chromatin assembly and remodelling N-terminal-domain-containing protein [Thamnocephalis sphaerospora]|uniref:ATP-utilizing chromatin assembly and remodelling N-terminal-domain-containing protein n=1 Tax=Thamnocephalis sphaerospora TaxID=78915 RepID=A0A4P9XPP5_9FUNG|nr:ATP-utilizing chromatin assembly and remodelling N-terminal-domain-containing protein [Thamnocephalis sphaerospora]|eukprot:RKP07852.1 ATP-utilizing chromatin assembly and remodelling N-terminal-domain-containing protein [Thamnocephalis sphaerospora]
MPEIHDGEEEQPCWMIRFTGETFRSYDEYLARYQFYRKPVWQCEHTGKQSLTYEQALESEQRSRRAVEERLPSRGLRRAILKLVQFQTSRIDNLVDEAYQKLQHRFFADEPVNYQADDGLVYGVRVMQVLPRRSRTSLQHILNDVPMPSPPPDELDVVDATEVEYRVRMMDAFNSDPSEHIVDGTYLSRNRQTFTKQLLRQFIRDAATKDNYVNAPWLVKPEIAHIYGISTQLPPALQVLRDEAARKKAKKKAHYDPLYAADERLEGRATPEKRTAEERKGSPEKKFKLEEEAAGRIKYPIDDLQLPLHERRMPPRTTCVPDVWFHDLFETWWFLCTFGAALELTGFSLEDFRMSVLHDSLDPLCRLTSATYTTLIRCAATDRDTLVARHDELMDSSDDDSDEDDEETNDQDDAMQEDAKHGKRAAKTAHHDGDADPLEAVELHEASENWWEGVDDEVEWEARLLGCMRELATEDTLPGYGDIARHLISIGVTPEDVAECYVTLRPEQKLAVMCWLIDLVVDGSVIRSSMDQRSEKVTELRKERMDISRELRKIVTQRADVEAQMNTDGETGSMHSERESTPLSTTHDPALDSDDSSGLTARQAKLRAKNLEREIKEAQRQREIGRAREELRTRRKLDEEERILLRKREKLDREISCCLAIRAIPLGYDRWYRRYWFVASVAGQEVANTGDRIYIQPPLEDERAALDSSAPALREHWNSACAEQHAGHWAYLNTEEQLDQLQVWLDPRGERELALRRALEKQRETILEAIEERQQQREQPDEDKAATRAEASRRSLRSRHAASANEPHLKYVNRLAAQS